MARKKAKASKGRGRATAPGKAKQRRATRAKAAVVADAVAAVHETPALPGLEPVMLPQHCESSSSRGILSTLLAARGGAVEIDASQVRRAGTQSLQVLLSAARTWQTDGLDFRIVRPSAEFVEAATMLGLSPAEMRIEEIAI